MLRACCIAFFGLVVAPPPAHGQRLPATLPVELELTLERPDEPGSFLQFRFERDASGGHIDGCETEARDVGCRHTRRLDLTEAQFDALERRWRAFAAGARCRVRRPEGNWTPFTLTWPGGSATGQVYERADRGLSARCFAIERIGGFFLRVFMTGA
jgi:hypothetical protein